MKRFLSLALLISCLHNPDAAPAHYVIFGPYCWHEDAQGKWHTDGLASRCPPNTRGE